MVTLELVSWFWYLQAASFTTHSAPNIRRLNMRRWKESPSTNTRHRLFIVDETVMSLRSRSACVLCCRLLPYLCYVRWPIKLPWQLNSFNLCTSLWSQGGRPPGDGVPGYQFTQGTRHICIRFKNPTTSVDVDELIYVYSYGPGIWLVVQNCRHEVCVCITCIYTICI